ncbi:hypothetical protein ACLB2K_065030 [Fragaria x ananassa]
MAFPSTKSLVFCLVILVSMAMLSHGFGTKRFDVVNPAIDLCKLPNGLPRPGCTNNDPEHHPETPASPYKRGCSFIHRCIGDVLDPSGDSM